MAGELVMIGGEGLGKFGERRIAVAALEIAEHLIVGAIFLNDVNDVMNAGVQELGDESVSISHGAEMVVARDLRGE